MTEEILDLIKDSEISKCKSLQEIIQKYAKNPVRKSTMEFLTKLLQYFIDDATIRAPLESIMEQLNFSCIDAARYFVESYLVEIFDIDCHCEYPMFGEDEGDYIDFRIIVSYRLEDRAFEMTYSDLIYQYLRKHKRDIEK